MQYLRVLDMMLFDDVLDLVDEEDGHKSDHSDGEDDVNDALRGSQLSFVGVSVLIGVFLLVGLQDFSV